ncbi:MAG: ABC transporter ATP-binding protein [bacterium]
MLKAIKKNKSETSVKRQTARRLYSYIFRYKRMLISGLICMVICTLLAQASPLIIKFLIDFALQRRSTDLLALLSIGIILLYVVNGIFMFLHSYMIAYVGQKTIEELRNEVYNRLQSLDLRFFEKRRTGELMSRITNDVSVIQLFVSAGVVDLITVPIGLVAGFSVIVYLSAKLTLLAFVCMPFVAFLISAAGRKMKKVSTHMQVKLADISTILQETLSAIRIVKSFSMEDYEIERFQKESRQSFLVTMKGMKIRAALAPVVEILGAAGLAMVFWIGGRDVVLGTRDFITGKVLTAGDLVAFLFALNMIYVQFRKFNNIYLTLQQSYAAAERLFQVMDIHAEITEKPDAVTLPSVNGDVRFEHVYFAYDPGEMVLRGINIIIEPGTLVAIVGASGAGKTTFVNLIPRFYDVAEGRIMIDGYDVRDVKIASLREQMGIVPQETILFSSTVGENISYGKRGATQSEIEEAARAANAHEFILALPNGYDTVVGERGVNLSGGQRQRIAIARAILKNPRILILDEATSAVDSVSEMYIQEALERLMRGRTTFVIAHRLSTIQNADLILVLDRGEIVESGRHDELYAKGGYYRRLYDMTLVRESVSVNATKDDSNEN